MKAKDKKTWKRPHYYIYQPTPKTGEIEFGKWFEAKIRIEDKAIYIEPNEKDN